LSTWPFSTAELTAGLRRYFAETSLTVTALREQPVSVYHSAVATATRVRGLLVDYAIGPHTLSMLCLVKEPLGESRSGLAGAGRREAGVHRAFSNQLPMASPALIAADAAGGWLVFEAVDGSVAPGAWRAEHYRQAVHILSELHERFWNLADDLGAYVWLARPLGNDFEIHVHAAATALARMVSARWPSVITESSTRLSLLVQLVSQADHIAAPLRALPQTLLHGNFWPGTVSLQADGEMVVYDWHLASIGPGLLDLVTFVVNSQWSLGDLPLAPADLIMYYRMEVEARLSLRWSVTEWQRLWDHALLWRFLQETLVWLASLPHDRYDLHTARAFEQYWLAPVIEAAHRQLRPAITLSLS
jgi:hypothetical protein